MYNQRTTQENGTLEAPELALSGRIIERKKNNRQDSTRGLYVFICIDRLKKR